MAEQTAVFDPVPTPAKTEPSACDTCGRDDFEVGTLHVCPSCRGFVDAKLAQVKLRLSGDVDWEDIKKYGIYDRFGVPIATVLEVRPRIQVQQYATGPMSPLQPLNDELILDIRPLKR